MVSPMTPVFTESPEAVVPLYEEPPGSLEERRGSSTSSTDDVHCSMTLLERLIRTSSIWFLPDVGRTGAVHYLQGKAVGNFIVRQSSKKGTLALSVRLPVDAGPYIEHYLIEATAEAKHCLEGSENPFRLDTRAGQPLLPVLLCLPTVLLEATSRQELSALSLLGQELWVSSLLKSAPSSTGSSVSCASSQVSPNPDHNANIHVSSFKRSSPVNSVVKTPPVPATRPNFLALHSSTADTGELATQVADPPSPPDQSEAALMSEVAGRSAFYVGVDSTQSASPSKATPSKAAPDKAASIKSAPEKSASVKSASGKSAPVKSASVKPAPSKTKLPTPVEEEKPRCLMKPSPRRRRKLPESSPEYYSSSLADKISDYEDIWGTANGRGGDSPAPVLSTFKPEGLVCQATQTELQGGSMPEGIDAAAQTRNLSRSMPGMVNDKSQPGQFTSPFYSEPVDSLFLVVSALEPLQIDEGLPSASGRRERPLMRHSEPNVHSLRSSTHRSSDLTTTFDETNSCVSDHLLAVSAPALRGSSEDGPPSRCGRSWSVDPSWRWLVSSDDEDNDSNVGDLKFPVEGADDSDAGGLEENVSTVEEIIGISMPDLRVPPVSTLTEGNVLRASRYDNLDAVSVAESAATDGSSKRNHGEDDALTEFCEPWDSLRWERLLRLVESSPDAPESKVEESKVSFDSLETASGVSGEDLLLSECPTLALEHKRSSGFQEHLDMLLASRKLGGLYKRDSTVGADVKSYIFKLVQERNTTFAMTIENFIQCTRESSETSPAVVMRNIRQFMSGMKNYLLKHGEGQFEQLVQEEQSKLKPDEFMNIDAIIEVSLHRLVIKPLRRYLYQLFVKQYTQSGALKLLSDSMKYARTKTAQELGIKSDFEPPRGVTLELAISVIYSSVQRDRKSQPEGESFSLGADDFLPIFLHVLVQCGMVSAEVEADYMWGAAAPFSAHRRGRLLPDHPEQRCARPEPTQGSSNKEASAQAPMFRYPRMADLQGFMQIVIPDELSGSIVAKTLPVLPHMTAKEVRKMIAHKFRVTNPEDYGLFKLVKGEETQLTDNDCPQAIKADLLTSGVDCRFAYKRYDVKFVWPFSDKPA
ncbi:hypothetical protein MRX96_058000 [Rhipicephalus microplus]